MSNEDYSTKLEFLRKDFANMKSRLDRHFEKLAGPDLSMILSSVSSAQSFLSHPDKNRRIAAIWALSFRFPHCQETAELFEKLALNDPDIEVRAGATGDLGMFYYSTKNPRIERFLAGIVVDEKQALPIRDAAYRALFMVEGVPLHDSPPFQGFNLLSDADWNYVKSFLKK